MPPDRPLALSLLCVYPCLYSDANAISCCGKLPQRRVGPSLRILVMASLVSVFVPLHFLSPGFSSFVQNGALRPPAVGGSGIRTPCLVMGVQPIPCHPIPLHPRPSPFLPPSELNPQQNIFFLGFRVRAQVVMVLRVRWLLLVCLCLAGSMLPPNSAHFCPTLSLPGDPHYSVSPVCGWCETDGSNDACPTPLLPPPPYPSRHPSLLAWVGFWHSGQFHCTTFT